MRHLLAFLMIGLCVSLGRSQWLPAEQQERLKSLWPMEVPFPPGLRFYRLPAAYQKLVVLDGRDYRAFHATSQDEHNSLAIWRAPGGLAWSDRREWLNAVALAIPEGKSVEWWLERVQVPQAPRNLPALKWAFPDGTIAVDMLIRTGAEGDKCFEVRVREKRDGRWDDGVAYRPKAGMILENAEASVYGIDLGRNLALGVREVRFPVLDIHRFPRLLRFSPSRTVVRDDGELIPNGYVGPGLSCRKCHEPAGKVLAYGTMLRGGDTVLSWHPVKASSVTFEAVGREPELDERWPLIRRLLR